MATPMLEEASAVGSLAATHRGRAPSLYFSTQRAGLAFRLTRHVIMAWGLGSGGASRMGWRRAAVPRVPRPVK